MQVKDLISYITSSLIEDSDRIKISETESNQKTVIELKVDSKDLGKIIGRQGRTANALRTIVNASALKAGKRIVLEIIESNYTETD